MESETSNIEPEADENVDVSVEESKDSVPADKVEQEENIVNNTVIEKEPAAVIHEALFPDVTRFNYDVQYGYRTFCELLTDQYKSITRPFYEPVDVEALGLWDYNTRIETPMSFKQIESKFMNYSYEGITEIVSDMRLILENCYRYNGSDHWISKLAQKLEKILDQKLALLNRSLRDKVTLQATMAFRNNKAIIPESEELGVRRRRSGRSSYSNTTNGDQTSRLVSQLILEEEEAQKELKRLKEKEKKEATEALLQELNEWENEIFTPDVLIELQSMWEIPSIGCFLWLFKEALNLPELNFNEFESGLVIPHKSTLIASIFSVLLCTANQRKSFHKKPPMKFAVWEKKLKERMDLWYMTREAEEFRLVAHQIGLDHEFFEILGNSNPLEQKSYLDLSLHQRVLILKALCDECLDYEPQMRDYLGSTEVTPFRESILGSDESNWSYVYFPIFDATDIRIYKQAPMPSVAEWYRKWTTASKAISSHSKPGCPRQSKSKKSGSRSKESCTSIKDGFELVCFDMETLRGLCEKFSDQTTTPSGKKRRGRPTRKRSEIDLHNVLTSLLEELVPAEGKYSRAKTKGMVNLMKDWNTVEEEEEVEEGEEETSDSDEESFTQDHDEVRDPLEECQATPMITKPTLEKQDIHSEPQQSTEQKPWGEDVATNLSSAGDNSENHFVNSNGDCSLSSMITRSKQKTTKKTFCVKESSTPLLETNVSRNNDNSNDIQSEVPEISSLSENLDTTNDVHTKDSDTVLSGKTEIIIDARQGLFPEKVVVSMNSDSAAQVTHIPELEVQNGGAKEDYGGSKDTSGIMGSCDDRKDISTEDTKKDNQLNGTNDAEKKCGMQDDDGNVSTQGNPEGESISSIVHENDSNEVDNRDSHDNQEQLSKKTSIENRCKTKNSVDITDNKECGGTSVYENGICNELGDICNGAQSEENYEPSIKRHCSADNHIPMSLPTGNGLDGISLETSHQSSVKPTVNNEVKNHVTALETESAKNRKTMSLPAGNELDVFMETSHQSPVKAMGEDVENHVINLTNPVG